MSRVGICVLVTLLASPAFAQEKKGEEQSGDGAAHAAVQGAAATAESAVNLKALTAIGAGIVMLGAGFGIGRIGGSAVESMSRQPEVAGNIQTAMIISAALIEGATFFGLIVCMLVLFF
jgi:F-type H+-transporting ATPase subunit c